MLASMNCKHRTKHAEPDEYDARDLIYPYDWRAQKVPEDDADEHEGDKRQQKAS